MGELQLFAPENYNIIDEITQFASDESKIALIVYEANQPLKKITYAKLMSRANQLANYFQLQGLQKGDRIVVMLPRSEEAYIVYIAALQLGLAIIPCSDQLQKRDIEYRLYHAQAKAIVYNQLFQLVLNEEIANGVKQFVVGEGDHTLLNNMERCSVTFERSVTSRDDLAFISYTSGTTGSPKGAMHYHSWGYAHIRTTAQYWLSLEENDVVWATAAPGWQKWIWTPFLATLGSGATAIIYKGKFDAATYNSLIRELNVNVLCCTPTEYRMMLKDDSFGKYDYPLLKSVVSAGEPLNKEVIDRFYSRYQLSIRDGYGQTENTLLVGTLLNMEHRIGSIGKPTPGNKVEIIDMFGEPVPVGEVGDIAVHIETPALFKGYYREPERTAMQFRGEWYVTGDRARKDEAGYYWFEGRADDMIISAGYTIGPFDIEAALLQHPDVQECAVVASPDPVRGNVVKAFVVLKEWEMAERPSMKEELQNFVKQVVAPYSYPRKIEFLEELPKTMSGKIRRYELRKREQSNLAR